MTNDELIAKLNEMAILEAKNDKTVREMLEVFEEQVKALKTPHHEEMRRLGAKCLMGIKRNGWVPGHHESNSPPWGDLQRLANASKADRWSGFGHRAYRDTIQKLSSAAKDNWKLALGIEFEIASIRRITLEPEEGVFYDQSHLSNSKALLKAGKTASCFLITSTSDKYVRADGVTSYVGTISLKEASLRGTIIGFNPRSGKIQVGSGRYSVRSIYYPDYKDLLNLFMKEEKAFREKIRADAAIYMLDTDPYIRWCAGVEHKRSKQST